MERKFRITVNGKQYDVTVEELSDASGHLLPQPGDMQIPSPSPPGAPAPAVPEPMAAAGANELPSPLAGLVFAVDVASGDKVEKGQTLVVIDSMKMKTTVVADRSGNVTEVFVKAGDSVDAGQALLHIE